MKLIKTLQIIKATPWSLNEHEGELIGMIDDREVCVYTILPNEEAWKMSTPRDIQVELWLERGGGQAPQKHSSNIEPSLVQIQESWYEITGKVIEKDEEMVMLRSIMDLPVDLDITPAVISKFPIVTSIDVGDWITVKGLLKVRFCD
jgi:hypothetical protein